MSSYSEWFRKRARATTPGGGTEPTEADYERMWAQVEGHLGYAYNDAPYVLTDDSVNLNHPSPGPSSAARGFVMMLLLCCLMLVTGVGVWGLIQDVWYVTWSAVFASIILTNSITRLAR